ncbi:MAG: ABC transporter permease [Acidobacteriaceae bacterium]
MEIGEFLREKVMAVQEYSILSWTAIANIFRRPFYWGDFFTQADLIGVGSVPIVILTGFFTGGVLALNSTATLAQFGAKAVTGTLVSLSMVKELGPVLTGLMVSGRNASGMASELGSMQVTEQIDAMRALGTDPVKKLITPRVLSTIIMLVFLTIISDALGILGGGWISSTMGISATQYFHMAYQSLRNPDILEGLMKPLFFGYIIATIGCYFGMSTRGGTQGVGRSTTQAVVYSSILIIFSDFLISRLTIGIFGR